MRESKQDSRRRSRVSCCVVAALAAELDADELGDGEKHSQTVAVTRSAKGIDSSD